jgi:acyl CoA:acetate/3-ketoacid CoA transferase
MNENQMKINKVIDNLGFEKYALLHLKGKVKTISYAEEREIFHEIMNNKMIINEIKKNIHIKDNILETMETALTLDKNSDEYAKLKSRIINVGEFKND